jgi:hypothetical protein
MAAHRSCLSEGEQVNCASAPDDSFATAPTFTGIGTSSSQPRARTYTRLTSSPYAIKEEETVFNRHTRNV